MSFGKNLQFLRHLRENMTQEDLAEKMNISRQTISKWELELVHRCWWLLCYLSNHLKTTAIGNNTPTATVRSIKQSTSNTPSINFCTIPPMFSPPQHHQQ